ncbi:MAG: phosphoglycerate dehydrogenase [Treponema sp.]|nr:phosphoglycerate dehydrogenase [Treponema sp.]
MFRIKTINKISPHGLKLFPKETYEVGSDITDPDAILLRSAELEPAHIPESVIAIARAGAGYNNIPVSDCTGRGIAVFNTPGGNANAVKELVIAAILLSSRDIVGGIKWCDTIAGEADQVPDLVEKGKAKFEGPELIGKTLGVVGLGAVGVPVANAAAALGMKVIGFDPGISVDAAWNLSRAVLKADTLESLLSKSDYVSLHLPLSDSTEGLYNADKFKIMKKGSRLINMSRGGIVNDKDLIEALNTERLSVYVTDFPTAELIKCPRVINIPHLGASTPEAEDNCAVMAVQQLMDYLEAGTVKNSVNLPRCDLEKGSPYRLIGINRNIPNMVGQLTTILAEEKINIMDLINHHRDDYAYNIIDTEQKISGKTLEKIKKVEGIIRIRTIE